MFRKLIDDMYKVKIWIRDNLYTHPDELYELGDFNEALLKASYEWYSIYSMNAHVQMVDPQGNVVVHYHPIAKLSEELEDQLAASKRGNTR